MQHVMMAYSNASMAMSEFSSHDKSALYCLQRGVQQSTCRCHINRQVVLSRPQLWWDESAHGRIAERAIYKQAMPAEGGQYEPKQAAIQC